MAVALVAGAVAWGATGCGADSSGLRGRVLQVDESRESVPYAVVTVEIENPTTEAVRMSRYGVQWSGGSKTVDVESVIVPAGGKVTRTLRIDVTPSEARTLSHDPSLLTVVMP